MKSTFLHLLAISVVASAALCAVARADDDDFAYKQTNLVSDGAVTAKVMDPQLKNPWGIAAIPGAPFWISDNATGVSTLYDGKGDIVPLTVKIPPPSGAASGSLAAPTGIVWNPNPNLFAVAPKMSALFIFSTEDGTISAWNPTVNLNNAVLEVDNSSSAVYKGLALATNSTGVFLYATNFRMGTVDVFDSSFKPVKLAGSFHDAKLPEGYAPFGIALIDGNLFVTYALQDAAKHDDVKGAGHGFVDVFDTDGHLIKRFASRGSLNSPWAVVRAPVNFGPASSRVLVGNFGDGKINSFDSFGDFRGALRSTSGSWVKIPGLWGLMFGDAAASSPSTLYFTAGTNDEADGLFGSLDAVPTSDHDGDDK